MRHRDSHSVVRCSILLLLLAACHASGAPVEEPKGYWNGPINSPVPATIRGGKVIHAEALAKLLERGSPVVIDVSNTPKRPEGMAADAPWLPVPQHVIPGSLWIPDVGMADIDPRADKFFREQLAQATSNDRDRLIVIYCHETCWLSWNAAKRAINYGYRNVHWFPEGIEGWRAQGFKTVVAEPQGEAVGG